MCATCGCSDAHGVTITDPAAGEHAAMTQGEREHAQAHRMGLPRTHDGHARRAGALRGDTMVYRAVRQHADTERHVPGRDREPGAPALAARMHQTTITVEQEVLAKNQQLAQRNRVWFEQRGILALNLVSSPGSGKTTLLERTIRDLHGQSVIQVIEGDQATINDAQRIRATGCKVIQINTGAGCHLEADMLARGLVALNPERNSIVMIENVGNLVCPALFDLGERAKVVILSVTEGEDKPAKYPHMFKASQAMLLNKIDLLPHLQFDADRCVAYARQVNPALQVFRVSAQTGEGMAQWYDWLRTQGAGVLRSAPGATANAPA
jgi:hydrogenase nickel incorporation protein HypB